MTSQILLKDFPMAEAHGRVFSCDVFESHKYKLAYPEKACSQCELLLPIRPPYLKTSMAFKKETRAESKHSKHKPVGHTHSHDMDQALPTALFG